MEDLSGLGDKVNNNGLNRYGKLTAEEFNKLIRAVIELQKGAGQGGGSGGAVTLGGLTNVEDSADAADDGSLLVKGEPGWTHVVPEISQMDDYENMLVPVWHTVLKKWIFVRASGNDKFTYLLPFKLK